MTEYLDKLETRPVAFFDFDGTLTTGDTLMPFLRYVVGTQSYYAKLALVSPTLVAYTAKLLRNDIAKQVVLKQYLANRHISNLFELGQRFSAEVIPTMLRPEGMERLRWHQSQGHECVLVSASLEAYLNTWANHEQFSGVICTSLETNDSGHVTGKIYGENCYGEEKLRRVIDWQINRSPTETYAYGDSSGDLPILDSVDKGYIWKRKRKGFELLKKSN